MRCYIVTRIINVVSILYYIFIEFIILLYTFFVISFAWYKEYMICRILFNKFSDVLPAFTCANATGNPWSICLGVINLSPLPDIFVSGEIYWYKYNNIVVLWWA